MASEHQSHVRWSASKSVARERAAAAATKAPEGAMEDRVAPGVAAAEDGEKTVASKARVVAEEQMGRALKASRTPTQWLRAPRQRLSQCRRQR